MGSGSLSGSPPVPGATVKSSEKREKLVRVELNRIRDPSGVHPSTMSGEGWNVTRLGTPPSLGTVNTSTLPSYSPVKAIWEPSGENFGFVFTPAPAVIRLASPPSRGTLQRSPA